MNINFDLTIAVTTNVKNAHDEQVSNRSITETHMCLRGNTSNLHV